jgi:hypothetical protein
MRPTPLRWIYVDRLSTCTTLCISYVGLMLQSGGMFLLPGTNIKATCLPWCLFDTWLFGTLHEDV